MADANEVLVMADISGPWFKRGGSAAGAGFLFGGKGSLNFSAGGVIMGFLETGVYNGKEVCTSDISRVV